MYLESDWPNPRDPYGRTKLLGEVQNSILSPCVLRLLAMK